jgi:hypothetical protein
MNRGMILLLGFVVLVLVAIDAAMFPDKFGVGNNTVMLIARIIGFGGAIGLLIYAMWSQFRRSKKDLKKS